MIGAYLKAYMKEKGIKQSFIAERLYEAQTVMAYCTKYESAFQ